MRALLVFALAGWLLVMVAPCPSACADVTLPKVLDDHMVLQRDVPVTIWGWADPGEEVGVELGVHRASTQADANGDWKVVLEPMEAATTPQRLTVRGKNTVVLTDILVGEVWVGSGQSNMEWPLQRTQDPEKTIARAKDRHIRLFHVPKVTSEEPARDVAATWRTCTPESAATFSAVLYHFGQTLHKELQIPIGLINSSWGGSAIGKWTVAHADQAANGGMYNAMIHPLQAFPVRGVVWYQGESNVLEKIGFQYFDRMKALIEGWRRTWENDDLSFYFVQLAPWAGRYAPGQLPAVWEAQAAALKLPKTGMVVTTDLVDDVNDIHPRNKKDVGERLARWALARDYGDTQVVVSGPLYSGMEVEGDRIRLFFAHTAGRLTSSDRRPLREFQIAGDDDNYVDATAKVEGETVVVWADGVDAPKHVRFGWHKTAMPNLVNKAGLPAAPFRTDGWRGGTAEER